MRKCWENGNKDGRKEVAPDYIFYNKLFISGMLDVFMEVKEWCDGSDDRFITPFTKKFHQNYLHKKVNFVK